MSKPILYTFGASIWSAVPLLALAELGVNVDLRIVNLVEGENFNPEYLKINPNATVPALTYGRKSFTSTVDAVNYLVSISSVKVAHDTPITTIVHEKSVDPNMALVAARNDEDLAKVSRGFPTAFTKSRLGYLKRYAETPGAQANKSFYDKRITSLSSLCVILDGQAPDEAKKAFFSDSSALWDGIKAFTIQTLPAAITEGPFIGGSRPGVDDYHVGAWLARIANVLGTEKSEGGVPELERGFGPLPEKVKTYWAAWIARDSWVNAYPDNVLY